MATDSGTNVEIWSSGLAIAVGLFGTVMFLVSGDWVLAVAAAVFAAASAWRLRYVVRRAQSRPVRRGPD